MKPFHPAVLAVALLSTLVVGGCTSATAPPGSAVGNDALIQGGPPQAAGSAITPALPRSATTPIDPDHPQMPKVGDFCKYGINPDPWSTAQKCWNNNTLGERLAFSVHADDNMQERPACFIFRIINTDGLTASHTICDGNDLALTLRPGDTLSLNAQMDWLHAWTALTVVAVAP